jgi:hypothetical protein
MGGQMLDGFADDLKVADNSVDGFLVRLEFFERQAFDVPLDLGDCIEDVLDAQPPFSRSARGRNALELMSRLSDR